MYLLASAFDGPLESPQTSYCSVESAAQHMLSLKGLERNCNPRQVDRIWGIWDLKYYT